MDYHGIAMLSSMVPLALLKLNASQALALLPAHQTFTPRIFIPFRQLPPHKTLEGIYSAPPDVVP